MILGGFVFVLIFPTWEDSKYWPPIYDLEFGSPSPWLRWNIHHGLDGITFHGWRPISVDILFYILVSTFLLLTIELSSAQNALQKSKEASLFMLIILAILTMLLFNEAFWYSVLLGFFAPFDSAYYRDRAWWTFVYLFVPVGYLSVVALFARCYSDAVIAGVIVIIGGAVLVLSYALNTKGWI